MSLKTRTRTVTDLMAEAISSVDPSGLSEDVLKTLKEEHNEVKQLLNDLSEATAATKRKDLVKRIRKALVPHTQAEQKVVYDAVLGLRDREAKVDGYEGYLEHELAATALKRLVSIANGASPEHHATAKVLQELVTHHIREEESALWGDVKEHFSLQQRERMNRAYLAAKRRVRLSA
jgi:hemerythrin-like domain-containing protein